MNKYEEYSQSYASAGDDLEEDDYSMKLLLRMNSNRCRGLSADSAESGETRVDNGIFSRIDSIENRFEDVFPVTQVSLTNGYASNVNQASQTSSETNSDSDSIKSCPSIRNTDDELQGIIESFSTAI